MALMSFFAVTWRWIVQVELVFTLFHEMHLIIWSNAGRATAIKFIHSVPRARRLQMQIYIIYLHLNEPVLAPCSAADAQLNNFGHFVFSGPVAWKWGGRNQQFGRSSTPESSAFSARAKEENRPGACP